MSTKFARSTQKKVLLPVPPRLQWANSRGYCGETSIQSIGLYYGVWISQQIVRDVGDGETLLGVNAEEALSALHFQFESWPSQSEPAQFENFMVWLKRHLLEGFPAMIGVYLRDDIDDPDYDHIVAVTGVKSHGVDQMTYDPDDKLIFNNNFSLKPMTRTFRSLQGTRQSCRSGLTGGGCIPRDVSYGAVIFGLKDQNNITLPIRLVVNCHDEPNVPQKEPSKDIEATVIVTGLLPNKPYALLRYHDFHSVPTSGGAADFLTSSYEKRHDFTAQGSQWNYVDQQLLPSHGVFYYRCVPLD